MAATGSPRTGIQIIATVNAVAAAVTLAFWAAVYLRLFAGQGTADPVRRASSAATLGFLVGDLAWAVPLLILSVPGVWRKRAWGWFAAQAVNVLWFYSMTVVWVRDVYARTPSPGGLMFAPFALFAVWAAVHLWRVRDQFWAQAATRADAASIDAATAAPPAPGGRQDS
jgi:hypothetical protein